jgi:hypothetical protein
VQRIVAVTSFARTRAGNSRSVVLMIDSETPGLPVWICAARIIASL